MPEGLIGTPAGVKMGGRGEPVTGATGAGASTLRAKARPFIPPQGARIFAPAPPQPPRRNGERGGAARRVQWQVDPVSDTRHIPRVPSDEKARLFHTSAEIKR